MTKSIMIKEKAALDVARDMKQLQERVEKFQKEHRERFQQEFNEFMQAASKESLENIERMRFACGLPASFKGWGVDWTYLQHGVIFLVQNPTSEEDLLKASGLGEPSQEIH